ncbi:MAG TPA: ATP-binding protein [Pyrinomonadaceae bacterium]
MSRFSLIYNFRVRLLLVLAGLLLATLGVQYLIERRAQGRTAHLIAEQEQALARSTSLALESIDSTKYLAEIDAERRTPLLERFAGRVINVLLVNEDGRVADSLDPKYRPSVLAGETPRYFHITEVGLPKLAGSGPGMTRLRQLLPAQESEPVAGEPRSVPIVLRTARGMTYIIIVLGSANMLGEHSRWPETEPLLTTLAVSLVATLATFLLVWRFMRPISELTAAAQMVAAGNFNFRVTAAARRDEIGALASTFNEMLAGLQHTRELETQLHQAERSAVVGRLASAIAHEIKNPLNYINLTLDHLRTGFAPETEPKRAVFERLTMQVKTEVARVNTRIKEFLNYTRPTTLELRPLDLAKEVRDALNLIEVQAEDCGVETLVEQEGEIPAVAGDPVALRSLFTNLMLNALHSMEGRGAGRLTVSLSQEGGFARVRISDTGSGIAAENLGQIFEPYFSTKETGTGLGLAIAKKAAEDHGGSIAVESSQDAGTTFTVLLPIAAANHE